MDDQKQCPGDQEEGQGKFGDTKVTGYFGGEEADEEKSKQGDRPFFRCVGRGTIGSGVRFEQGFVDTGLTSISDFGAITDADQLSISGAEEKLAVCQCESIPHGGGDFAFGKS